MYAQLDATSAAAEVDEVTALTPALSALGFVKLGAVRVRKRASSVWVSADRTAFAEPEWHPGPVPHLSFRSVFEDGSILQTAQTRQGWVKRAPFWPRQHHPASGYFLEERDGMPHELWAAHRERVAKHAAERGTKVVSSLDLEHYVALAERAVKLSMRRTLIAQGAGFAVFLPLVAYLTVRRDLPVFLLPSSVGVWLAMTGIAFRLSLRSKLLRSS